jgi:predicted nucleic acid-binding protein
MACLVDTSVLARIANTADASHGIALAPAVELHRRGEILHVCAQNLIEFRSVATRPLTANGLGLSAADAEAKAAVFEFTFPLLDDSPGIYPAWKAIVASAGVVGKQVHDARLVAVCHVHAVTHLLTFNVTHFNRFAGIAPGITVVDPADI